VYPAEVEAALEQHPGVERACVVGVPDETWGEIVCAAIVPRGAAPIDLDQHLSAMLASFKRPRRFAIVASLPETPQGKRDRAAVRRTFEVDTRATGRDTRLG
jgi:fatty-acyl-CoA synthase